MEAECVECVNRGFVIVNCFGRGGAGQEGTKFRGSARGIQFDDGGRACGCGGGVVRGELGWVAALAKSSVRLAAEPAAAERATRRAAGSGAGAGTSSVSASIPDCGTSSTTSSSLSEKIGRAH